MVLQRIRTGMEEVDWVAMVKCVVLRESSIKHRKNKDHDIEGHSCAGSAVLKTNTWP